MNITKEWLKKENACEDAYQWAAERLNGGKPVAECIERMERADWLLWLLWHSRQINARQIVKLACVVGRFSLRHIPKGEDCPRKAYEAAETWVENPTEAAARAADRAAWAAGAARAAWAAWAAGAAGAARAAVWAAWAADRDAEHEKMCTAIRVELEKSSFKALVWPLSASKVAQDGKPIMPREWPAI